MCYNYSTNYALKGQVIMTTSEKIMTLNEFAEEIQMKPATIRLWIRKGKLKPYGKTPGGRYLFSSVQIKEYWEKLKQCSYD